MRVLTPPPDAVIDPLTREPRYGAFRGSLPPVDLAGLGKGRLERLFHHKRWMYLAIASDELFLAVAVVDLGYLMTAFTFAQVAGERGLRVDRSVIVPPRLGEVNDTAGEGSLARVRLGRSSLRIARPAGAAHYVVDIDVKDLIVHARLDVAAAPPAIAAIAAPPGGVVNATEKRVLLDTLGEAIVAGRRWSLDGALAGYDYTNGYLARRTSWKWGFALGRARTGERVALNLTQGFVGAAECAVWVDRELFPIGEGRFSFDPAAPMSPWTVGSECGAVDLRFEPAGLHAEHKNFGIIASRFIQPVGMFRGAVRAGDRALELERVWGVVEDQEVLW
jgi:Protein of unknown function (DUF2804)